MTTDTKAILLVLLSTLGTSGGSAMLKLGSASVSLAHPLNVWLAVGIVLYVGAAGMFILALRTGELSVIYPLYGLNFVWINLIAHTFFDESLPPLKWVGIAAIIAGISLIGKSSRERSAVIVP